MTTREILPWFGIAHQHQTASGPFTENSSVTARYKFFWKNSHWFNSIASCILITKNYLVYNPLWQTHWTALDSSWMVTQSLILHGKIWITQSDQYAHIPGTTGCLRQLKHSPFREKRNVSTGQYCYHILKAWVYRRRSQHAFWPVLTCSTTSLHPAKHAIL